MKFFEKVLIAAMVLNLLMIVSYYMVTVLGGTNLSANTIETIKNTSMLFSNFLVPVSIFMAYKAR